MAEESELVRLAGKRIGTVLRGKYRVDRVLGVGGMAVVYKVTHRNQAEFALKMLHPELSHRDDVRTRFLREGYAANSVKHPNVVLVVDDDVAEDGAAFLVMELLEGLAIENLWERMGQRLPMPAALSVADQLLDVLEAAHEKGIVHRDIKPANLFAVADGTLKVLDFGIARVRDAAISQPGLSTGAGVLLGTPAFMAPEQAYAEASEIDGQTDVWAVGATLFTLLSGHSVHEGENAAQLMIRAATTRARPLESVISDVPPMVARVIERALAFEKTARWPSAAAMREAIERASLEVLGKPPDKNDLAVLLPPEAVTRVRSRPPQRPSVPWSVQPAAAPEPRSALPGGSTTAQPVSSERARGSPARRRKGMMLSVAGVVGIVVVGGLVLFAGSRSKSERTPAATVDPPGRIETSASAIGAAMTSTLVPVVPLSSSLTAPPSPPSTSVALIPEGALQIPAATTPSATAVRPAASHSPPPSVGKAPAAAETNPLDIPIK